MRFLSITLIGFIPFTYSGITELHIDDLAEVELVLGCNGCGKSSFLRELTPYPATKNDYLSDGKKIVTIAHDGHTYQLTSDFTNKSHTHSFLKDGVDLNIPGLTTIQEELIATELGYTPFMHTLITFNFGFTEMSRQARQEFLLEVSPIDLDRFIDLHEKTKAKLREIKSNLKLLYHRKAVIEAQMMDATILAKKEADGAELAQIKNDLANGIFAIKNILSTLTLDVEKRTSQLGPTVYSLGEMLDDARDIKLMMSKVLKCTHKDAVSQHELDSLAEDMIKLRTDITKLVQELEGHYKDYTVLSDLGDDEINTYERRVKEIDLILQTSKSTQESVALSMSRWNSLDIPTVRRVQEAIADILPGFIGNTLPRFFTPREYAKLSSQMDALSYEISSKTSALETLATRIKEFTFPKKPIKRDAVICSACDLFQEVFGISKLREKEYHDLTETYEKMKVRVATLEGRLAVIQRHLEAQNPVLKLRSSVIHLISPTIFSEDWVTIYLDDILLQSPRKLYDFLDEVYTRIKEKEYRTQLTAERTTILSKLETVQFKHTTSKEFLASIIAEKELRRDKIMSEYNHKEDTYKTLATWRKYHMEFVASKYRLEQYTRYLSQSEDIAEQQVNIEYYKYLLTLCTEAQIAFDNDLRAIDHVLNEQHALGIQLNKELLPLIADLTDQQSKYTELEFALSPTTGIPHKVITKNINRFLEVMNYLIPQIWCTPLSMVLMHEDDKLDYKFKVKSWDNTVPDMKLCSSGQARVINFAATVAAIIIKKLDIPIYLDESDNGLDLTHKQKYLEALKDMMSQGLFRQLFMISHHAILSEGFNLAHVICLNDDHIVVPDVVNQGVYIKY